MRFFEKVLYRPAKGIAAQSLSKFRRIVFRTHCSAMSERRQCPKGPRINSGRDCGATWRLDLLSTPLFVVSVGLLVFNDFVLKDAYHNWLTGKLSDVTGLIAFTLFCCAVWPARRWTVASLVSIAFVLWKSPYSGPLILLGNKILPFAIGRTIDYTDCLALSAVWLTCGYSPRMRPWPARRWLVSLFAGFSLFAFVATAAKPPPRYSVVRSAEIPAPQRPSQAATVEAPLQELFDTTADRHGLRCVVCDPLSAGRLYVKSDKHPASFSIAVSFDPQLRVLFFNVSSEGVRALDNASEIEAIRQEIESDLQARFPEVKIANAGHGSTIRTSLGVRARSRFDFILSNPNLDDYRRALVVADRVASKFGLTRSDSSEPERGYTLYYLGRLFGPRPSDRSLTLTLHRESQGTELSVVIYIVCNSLDHWELQDAIIGELGRQLEAEFGNRGKPLGQSSSDISS